MRDSVCVQLENSRNSMSNEKKVYANYINSIESEEEINEVMETLKYLRSVCELTGRHVHSTKAKAVSMILKHILEVNEVGGRVVPTPPPLNLNRAHQSTASLSGSSASYDSFTFYP